MRILVVDDSRTMRMLVIDPGQLNQRAPPDDLWI
jgi:hypothetical protein